MIVLLLWAAGFAALTYEAARHGGFALMSQSFWVLALFVWGWAGAAVCRRLIVGHNKSPLRREAWEKAVRELAAKDARERAAKEAP